MSRGSGRSRVCYLKTQTWKSAEVPVSFPPTFTDISWARKLHFASPSKETQHLRYKLYPVQLFPISHYYTLFGPTFSARAYLGCNFLEYSTSATITDETHVLSSFLPGPIHRNDSSFPRVNLLFIDEESFIWLVKKTGQIFTQKLTLSE